MNIGGSEIAKMMLKDCGNTNPISKPKTKNVLVARTIRTFAHVLGHRCSEPEIQMSSQVDLNLDRASKTKKLKQYGVS